MSIIQKIREKAAWLVFGVIALSLLGFLLMDARPGQGGLFGGNSSVVGKINGKKIEYLDYQEKIKQVEDQYAAQGYPMDMMRERLQDQVWDQYIQEELMKEETEKLGIQVSSKELEDMLFVNPSPDLRRMLSDPKTGQFDPNQLKQQIAAIKKKKDKNALKQFNDFISGIMQQRLIEKYNSLIGNTAYIPKWMLEKTNADNSAIASISYVNVPYSTISDSTISVTDEDITAYLNKHKDEYKQEVSRSIYYVSFDASPSGKDSVALYEQLEQLKAEFAKDTNENAFLIRNGTETNFFDGYVAKSKMEMPNKDSIQNLADGVVYGPYLDGNKYVMAKMIGKRTMPDSVKVRHILIGTTDPRSGQELLPDSVAKNRADSIAAAVKGGADFAMLTMQYSTDEGSKNKGGEYEFASSQFGSLAKEFAEVSFYGVAGEKKVIKTQFGYHYIEVINQKNFEPAYKVAYMSKSIVPSDETDHLASGAANQFAGESRTAKAFEDNVVKRKYNKLIATDIRPTASTIPALGNSRQLVRWVYEADKGNVSEPFSIGDKYVVAMVSEINKEGVMSAAKARPMVEHLVRNKKKAEAIVKKLGTPASLEAAAKAYAGQVLRADSVTFSNGVIPNVGQEAKVVGAAFNKQWQGKVSQPITGNGGVFVIKTENISAVPNASGDIEQQRSALLAQMKQAATYRTFDALKKAATIKDNRAKFL